MNGIEDQPCFCEDKHLLKLSNDPKISKTLKKIFFKFLTEILALETKWEGKVNEYVNIFLNIWHSHNANTTHI